MPPPTPERRRCRQPPASLGSAFGANTVPSQALAAKSNPKGERATGTLATGDGKTLNGTSNHPRPPRRPIMDVDDASDAESSEIQPPRRHAPGEGAAAKPMPSTPRRRRLIDALAAQRTRSPEPASMPADEGASQRTDDSTVSSLPSRSASAQDLRLRGVDRRGATPSRSRVKFTYNKSRSNLSESRQAGEREPPSLEADEEETMSSAPGLSSPSTPALVVEEDQDDDDTQPAIKSIHELRRAGANNRFSDELDDLLGRIGAPDGGSLTMRRNALCELASRLQRDSFAGQFRDHGSRDKVAKGIGKEDDVVSGFALTAALIVFLEFGPAPHLLRQLCNQGLGRLLGRLLRTTEDMDVIASQRQTNLARAARASVHGVKVSLTRMPIWHGSPPDRLSPRTVALRLLETVARCSDGQLLETVVGDLERDLIRTAAECAAAEGEAGVDEALVITALQVLSSAGITPGGSHQGPGAAELPASVASMLPKALRRWPDERGDTAVATLKLAINITNTASGTAAFDDGSLLSRLATCMAESFGKAQEAIDNGRLEDDMYDGLLLLLGLVINIVEHCPAARLSMGNEPLGALVSLWQGNQLAASEADSVEMSKFSVATGYLAVLLGYLCLARTGRQLVEGTDAGMRGLITSIRDFAVMHETVDSKTHELELLVNELRQQMHSGR
ncbi:Wings apart-like protein [Drechmeria coniospora]|uniref:Wings apart-like protein n=1 Tax=Drechmeria coniospora TaxID=98403 RepID=A0A151GN51_DRECN|nr:Wings apart-like protein [Drechmeria coniospora]KYK58533.1 Wings apart-like protein [Drechmeria coniospora]